MWIACEVVNPLAHTRSSMRNVSVNVRNVQMCVYMCLWWRASAGKLCGFKRIYHHRFLIDRRTNTHTTQLYSTITKPSALDWTHKMICLGFISASLRRSRLSPSLSTNQKDVVLLNSRGRLYAIQHVDSFCELFVCDFGEGLAWRYSHHY